METIDLLAACFLVAGLVFGIGACWAPAASRLRRTVPAEFSNGQDKGRTA